MDNWTQLGIAGMTLVILFSVVKYFVTAMTKKDEIIQDMANKFLELSKQQIEIQNNLKDSIDANTEATNTNTQTTRARDDHLTDLILQIFKQK